VKAPSVVEMVKKLSEQGYLIYKKNEGIYLTAEGEEIGRIIKDRHNTIFAFLKFIGVPEKIADEDACVIEHDLNPKTVEQIKNLVSFIETAPDHPQWLDHFAIYCNSGRHSCRRKGLQVKKTAREDSGREPGAGIRRALRLSSHPADENHALCRHRYHSRSRFSLKAKWNRPVFPAKGGYPVFVTPAALPGFCPAAIPVSITSICKTSLKLSEACNEDAVRVTV